MRQIAENLLSYFGNVQTLVSNNLLILNSYLYFRWPSWFQTLTPCWRVWFARKESCPTWTGRCMTLHASPIALSCVVFAAKTGAIRTTTAANRESFLRSFCTARLLTQLPRICYSGLLLMKVRMWRLSVKESRMHGWRRLWRITPLSNSNSCSGTSFSSTESTLCHTGFWELLN